MAGHALSITDGTTTISLSTSGVILNHYVPQQAEMDGEGNYKPVVEKIEITIQMSTTAQVQDKKLRIGRLLDAAGRRAARGVGQKIYLQYQPLNDATLWRSEVLGGSIQLANDAMTAFASATVRMVIVLKREYFWEGERFAIEMGDGSIFAVTGLRVYSHDDGSHNNWVTISNDQVFGELPAPLEIRLKNDSGGSYNSRNWYIANNTYSQSISLQIQGETDTGGSSVASGSESGGAYRSYNTASASVRYTIPAATVAAFSGRWAKVMLKMSVLSTSGGISDIYVKPVLMDKFGLVTIYAGTEVLLKKSEDYFQDLGNIPLPPGDVATDWEQMTLGLDIRTQDGVAETFGIDFVHFLPVDDKDKAYRHIEQRGMVLLANDEIVDDGIEGSLYFYESSKRHPILIGRGNPIFVYPGVDQKLHFLFDGEGSTVNWSYSVRAYMRPRRLTI